MQSISLKRSLAGMLFIGLLAVTWVNPIRAKGPGYISSELIFPLDKRPTPQCHASSIVQTADGTLVVTWFGGKHERNNDVGIWGSRQVNGKWSVPVEVADGSEGEAQDYPCWNPVLFQPRNGPLLLFYKVGPRANQWWGLMMTSTDNGKTWTNRHKLGTHKAVGSLIGPVKNRPIQLKDGSILCPSSTEHDGWRVHFERTNDLGKTWEVIGPIHDASHFDAIQPSLLQHGDGKMQILCRTKQSVIGQAWSDDTGKTWSKMSATSLPNPNSGTDAITLHDGRHLLVYNHTTRNPGFPSGRNMLNVAVSKDGTLWHAALVLERDKGEFSYPSIIQTTDGLVHVTYTWKRQSIKHVVIDPRRVQLKPIVEGRWPSK